MIEVLIHDVTLDHNEVILAATVGAMRHAESISKGRRDNHGLDASRGGLSFHVEGASGEMAFAKWRGMYWGPNVNSFKGADLGKDIQIRTSDKPSLIVRSDDDDTHAFVFMKGVSPTFTVMGWIYGVNAKNSSWLRSPGGRPPAYFVPVEFLTRFRGRP